MTGLFLLLVFFLVVITALKVFCFVELPPQKEKYPINYPLENPLSNFESIVKELDYSNSYTDFKAIYVRIIIFKSCYPEESLMGDILEGYYKTLTTAI